MSVPGSSPSRTSGAPVRAQVLRDVVATLDRRVDGTVPRDVPGLREAFPDDVDLVGVLVLRWSARLTAALDRALAPTAPTLGSDRRAEVCRAWSETAEQLPGTRRLLDDLLAAPTTGPELRALLLRSRDLERRRLAEAAGIGGGIGGGAGAGRRDRALETGRRLEQAARSQVRPRLADRLRSLLPA